MEFIVTCDPLNLFIIDFPKKHKWSETENRKKNDICEISDSKIEHSYTT